MNTFLVQFWHGSRSTLNLNYVSHRAVLAKLQSCLVETADCGTRPALEKKLHFGEGFSMALKIFLCMKKTRCKF